MPKRYTPNDKWSQLAAKEGYRARSVYKLKELDEKHRLLKGTVTVLDLGAAPGSWLQYAAEMIGPKGMLIGMDLQEIEPVEGAQTYVQDITDLDAMQKILKQNNIDTVDLILSDLAPATSGMKDIDQWRSVELSQAVVSAASAFLKPKGFCVIKVLQGSDFDAFLKEIKQKWDVKVAHAKASRDRSKEVYLILRSIKKS